MLTPSAPLAVAISVFGSLCYAFGIALQHHSVGEGGTDSVGFRAFLKLLTTPRWLLGLLLVGVSAACHLTALTFAPITLVQPIGILAIVWAVLLEVRQRRLESTSRLWATVAVAVASLAVFVVLAGLHTQATTHLAVGPVLATGIPIVVIALITGFLAPRQGRALRAFLWAASAAMVYGLATGMIRVGLITVAQPRWLLSPWFWAVVAVLVIGYSGAAWVVQQSFAAGRASVSVGVMTTVDPVMAVLFGIFALGEGARIGLWSGLAMAVTAALAFGAVGLLSARRDHPEHESPASEPVPTAAARDGLR
ncbi:DMT family protein [Mariniluteicoccus flavus]